MSELIVTSTSRAVAGNLLDVEDQAPTWLSRPLVTWQGSHFFLFVLLNGALLIRPTEIIPRLEHWPLYVILLLANCVISWRVIFQQLSLQSLARNPITAFVLGLLASIVISRLVHRDVLGAAGAGVKFSEVALYYLLLVGLVKTPSQLRSLLWCIALCMSVQTGLAVLQYHGAIDVPALAKLQYSEVNNQTGKLITQVRLRGAGIFNDPNDLSLLLVAVIGISLYALGDPKRRWATPLWLFVLALSAHALMLTKSRGGFMALLAGVILFLLARFGLKRSMLLAVVVLPVLFVLFAGRQTELQLRLETGQQRIQLWAKALALFARSPVFGIGKGSFSKDAGLVVHNSFLHCYTELGFFGGTCFLGAFYVALWQLWCRRPCGTRDSQLRRLRPYLLAIVAAYVVGMLSLSRAYVAPTYMIVGIAAVHLRLAEVEPSMPGLRLDGRLLLQVAAIGIAFLIAVDIFVRLTLQ